MLSRDNVFAQNVSSDLDWLHFSFVLFSSICGKTLKKQKKHS